MSKRRFLVYLFLFIATLYIAINIYITSASLSGKSAYFNLTTGEVSETGAANGPNTIQISIDKALCARGFSFDSDNRGIVCLYIEFHVPERAESVGSFFSAGKSFGGLFYLKVLDQAIIDNLVFVPHDSSVYKDKKFINQLNKVKTSLNNNLYVKVYPDIYAKNYISSVLIHSDTGMIDMETRFYSTNEYNKIVNKLSIKNPQYVIDTLYNIYVLNYYAAKDRIMLNDYLFEYKSDLLLPEKMFVKKIRAHAEEFVSQKFPTEALNLIKKGLYNVFVHPDKKFYGESVDISFNSEKRSS